MTELSGSDTHGDAKKEVAGRGWFEPKPIASIAALPSYVWFVVGTVCIGAFMGQVDASIAQLVLPVLEQQFHASLSFVSWVAVAYLLVQAVMLPIFGRLADMMGRKLLYTSGFLVFIVGSGLCGLASDIPWLIAARSLQALGSAMLGANSVAIVVAIAGDRRRGRAIGIMAAAQAVGLSTGPALGGLIIYTLGWRWVFWLNVPVGLLGLVIGWLVLPTTELPAERPGFDWRGALFIVPGLASLLLAVNQAGSWGLSSPAIWASVAAAVLLLSGFIWHERRAASPLLHLALFRKPAFALGNGAGLMANAILFALFFLMPFTFARAFHESPLSSGLRLTVIPLALGLLAPLSGVLSDRLGVRLLSVGGMLVTTAGLAALAFSLNGGPYGLFLTTISLAIVGIGEGLFTAPNNSAIMGAAPRAETGQAGGVLNLMRSLGTSIGIAAAAAMLSWRLDVLTGHQASMGASTTDVFAAVRVIVSVFAAVALAAAVTSLVRPTEPPKPDEPG